MQKLNLTVREMCEILEAEPVGVSASVSRRKVKLCLDSRQVEKGCVFWPICGERFDAHQFVEQAQNEGAIMSVVNENKVSQNTIQAYVPVKDTVDSFADIIDGKYDEYPEQAFLYVGTVADVIKKAKELDNQ